MKEQGGIREEAAHRLRRDDRVYHDGRRQLLGTIDRISGEYALVRWDHPGLAIEALGHDADLQKLNLLRPVQEAKVGVPIEGFRPAAGDLGANPVGDVPEPANAEGPPPGDRELMPVNPVSALAWLESLRGTEWISAEHGENGRRWPVGDLAEIILDRLELTENAVMILTELVTAMPSGAHDVTNAFDEAYAQAVGILAALVAESVSHGTPR